ncbi:MAG: galactokinase [Planctomycetota bacterium]|nr:galactokinase [Planctomycetota bacterium]
MTKSSRIIENGTEHFAQFSKHAPRVFFAPGRANLLGAHMDYNGGVVMPVALSKGTYVFAAIRKDNILRISSQQFGGEVVEMEISDLHPQRAKGWASYIEGALWATHQRWQCLSGLDVHVDSDLPIAKGLSSSASVISAVVKAVASLFDIDADCDEMIHLSHLAENRYVGVRCGVLDQTAIFLGQKNTILMFDCLELTRVHVPLDSHATQIAIIDSQISRELASSEFNLRVAECTSALSAMQKHVPGLTCLRELTANQFSEYKDKLSTIEQKRTRHVIDEVQRTRRGAKALRANNIAGFGACMTAAHYSLRDLLEVSINELDVIVKAATDVDGCYGARLTGAGFGGCVAALVHPQAKAEFEKHVCDAYKQQTNIQTSVQWFSPSGVVCEIKN